MALHDDLLEQATHLALREPKRPRQASLRRAISTAYYALYHLLVGEAARALAPSQPPLLGPRFQRAFSHSETKTVCKQVAAGALSAATDTLVSPPLEAELRSVAEAFVELQDARHNADYDMSRSVVRLNALSNIARATQAFRDWRSVRQAPNAKVFLAALLLQKSWSRATD